MNSVPLSASSNLPLRPSLLAPVEAPLSYPKNSDSASDSGNAAAFIFMKRFFRRLLRLWIACATSSLPVPVSPVISTVDDDLAVVNIFLFSSCMHCDSPIILFMLYFVLTRLLNSLVRSLSSLSRNRLYSSDSSYSISERCTTSYSMSPAFSAPVIDRHMHRYADSHICIVKHDHRFILIKIFHHLRLRKNISDMPSYDLSFLLRNLEIISTLLIYIKNDAIHIDHEQDPEAVQNISPYNRTYITHTFSLCPDSDMRKQKLFRDALKDAFSERDNI